MTKSIDSELDKVYDNIDALLSSSNFEQCNSLLRGLNVNETGTDLLLGYLTATFPAKSRLPYRDTFYQNVEKVMLERKESEPGLLTGLR